MTQVFVITSNKSLGQSLGNYFRHTRGIEVNVWLSSKPPLDTAQWVHRTFERIAGWMESKAADNEEAHGLRRSLAFVDLYDDRLAGFEELDPIALEKGSWAAVVAMLLLSFPEVHWVFNSPYKAIDNPLFPRAHLLGSGNTLTDILELHEAKFTPMFDPGGIRHVIREQLSKAGRPSYYVPLRHQAAAAVDEEETYVYLNGYTAYRLGYRTHIVSTHEMMRRVFQEKPAAEPVSLVFEDLFLNFPDQPFNLHLSDLQDRTEKFKGLENAENRILVTVGHEHPDEEIRERNAWFINNWSSSARRPIETVHKPLAGIFQLWEDSKLKTWAGSNNGRARGYKWPPEDLVVARRGRQGGNGRAVAGSHSAPGRLLEISECLIRRSEKIADHAHSVPEAIYGALLALEAQEYLGLRTPTSSLGALARKHTFEVDAECMFYGVIHSKDVKSRFAEIKQEVTAISQWLNKDERKVSQLDAEIGIVGELVLKFREHYQFDEEQKCLDKLRHLHLALWFWKHWWLRRPAFRAKSPSLPIRAISFVAKPITYLLKGAARAVGWYVLRLLRSIPAFLMAIVLWLGILSVLFNNVCTQCDSANQNLQVAVAQVGEGQGLGTFKSLTQHLPTVHGLGHAMTAFFGIQPPHSSEDMEQYGGAPFWLSTFAILLGFTHLGIFVSHLYSLIVRR